LKTGDFSTPIIPFLNQQGIRLLSELQRRKAKRGIVSMCIGGGMGAAGLNVARRVPDQISADFRVQ